MDALAGMLDRSCSDDEIERFAAGFLTDESRAQGYGEDDYVQAREAVTAWRDKYCRTRKGKP